MSIFREPWVLGIIILVIVLLFFAPKLPAMARSLGQSFRIIKSEVRESKNDNKDQPQDQQTAQSDTTLQGTVVNSPAAGSNVTPQQQAPAQEPVVPQPSQPTAPGQNTTTDGTNRPSTGSSTV